MQSGATVALIVGKTARKVSADDAASFIAGYALANDVSLPEESFYRPAIKAKCRDGFCPIGSLAPVDSVDNLTIITEINGREADSWNTGDLQRNAAELLSALSEFATLNPGDAILIGTPHARVTLQPGDRVRILAEGFPALENPGVAEGALAGDRHVLNGKALATTYRSMNATRFASPMAPCFKQATFAGCLPPTERCSRWV